MESGREPLESGWTLHAGWRSRAAISAELTYDLVGFFDRPLGGDLDAARSVFEHDIAEAEAKADRDLTAS